jgi:hypothetical protein
VKADCYRMETTVTKDEAGVELSSAGAFYCVIEAASCRLVVPFLKTDLNSSTSILSSNNNTTITQQIMQIKSSKSKY